MVGERNAQIQRRCPELVVIGRWISFATRIAVELDAFHSKLGAVFHFLDRVVDAGRRQSAHANEPVRRGGHVFLAQELVVSADAVFIEVVVFGLAQNKRDLGK